MKNKQKDKLLLVGAFAELCGATKKQIQVLEREELLMPVDIDQFSKYKYYSEKQVADYKEIMEFKEKYNLTFPEVKKQMKKQGGEVFQKPTAAQLREKVEKLRKEQAEALAQLSESAATEAMNRNEERQIETGINRKLLKSKGYTIQKVESGTYIEYPRAELMLDEEYDFEYTPESFTDMVWHNRRKCVTGNHPNWKDVAGYFTIVYSETEKNLFPRYRFYCCGHIGQKFYNLEGRFYDIINEPSLGKEEELEGIRNDMDWYVAADAEFSLTYGDIVEYADTGDNTGKALTYLHHGSYQQMIYKVIPSMLAFCKENNIPTCGTILCKTIVGPWDSENEEFYVTEIKILENQPEKHKLDGGLEDYDFEEMDEELENYKTLSSLRDSTIQLMLWGDKSAESNKDYFTEEQWESILKERNHRRTEAVRKIKERLGNLHLSKEEAATLDFAKLRDMKLEFSTDEIFVLITFTDEEWAKLRKLVKRK